MDCLWTWRCFLTIFKKKVVSEGYMNLGVIVKHYGGKKGLRRPDTPALARFFFPLAPDHRRPPRLPEHHDKPPLADRRWCQILSLHTTVLIFMGLLLRRCIFTLECNWMRSHGFGCWCAADRMSLHTSWEFNVVKPRSVLNEQWMELRYAHAESSKGSKRD